MEFDKLGNLFISGFHANNVRKINDAGIISRVAGTGLAGFSGDGGNADSAELDAPYGIAIDPFGNLYIADDGNSRIRKVTFNPVTTPTVAISASPGDTVCNGAMVTFTATIVGAVTPLTYQWLVNGTEAGTGCSYTYMPANGDSVRCVLSVNGLCATPGSNTLHIVTDSVAAMPAVSISGPSTGTPGSTATITATVAGAGSSYIIKWYNSGRLFATTTTPVVTYTLTAGIDSISATVIPISGCYDSASSAIHIIKVSNVEVPLAASQLLAVFPNPVYNILTVSGDISSIYLNNAIGQRQELPISMEKNGSLLINVSGMPAGVYVLTVTSKTGQKTVHKIIKM